MGRFTKELFGNKEERAAAKAERLAAREANNADFKAKLQEIDERQAAAKAEWEQAKEQRREGDS